MTTEELSKKRDKMAEEFSAGPEDYYVRGRHNLSFRAGFDAACAEYEILLLEARAKTWHEAEEASLTCQNEYFRRACYAEAQELKAQAAELRGKR